MLFKRHLHRVSGGGGSGSGQLSLSGFDTTPPEPTDRLFLAIYPDADTAERIARLAQHLRGEHGLQNKQFDKDRFHVTLHHLGDHAGLPHGIVNSVLQAVASISALPFDVVFDRAMSFSGRPRQLPFVLRNGGDNAALMDFQRTLGVTLAKAGLGRWVGAHYTPHLTLLYDVQSVTEHDIEPVGWTASEFVLVHSLLGQAKHVPLGRWPLRP